MHSHWTSTTALNCAMHVKMHHQIFPVGAEFKKKIMKWLWYHFAAFLSYHPFQWLIICVVEILVKFDQESPYGFTLRSQWCRKNVAEISLSCFAEISLSQNVVTMKSPCRVAVVSLSCRREWSQWRGKKILIFATRQRYDYDTATHCNHLQRHNSDTSFLRHQCETNWGGHNAKFH